MLVENVMNLNEKNFEVLLHITQISNSVKLDFKGKLQRILFEIVNCMNAKSGSIMLRKGKLNIEVAASTTSNLVGMKQTIEENSPSAWVVKNKKLLYSKDSQDKRHFEPTAGQYNKDAYIIAPILTHNKLLGVLSITEKIGVDSFSKKEQETLLSIVGHIIGTVETHRLTESLRRSKRTLQKKNLQLKNLEKIRKELFNMLIHDLKGPISEVVANLDILSYTVHDDENLEYVKTAQNGCDTLYRMVSDLLDIARLEEGSLRLLYEKIAPDDLMKESLSRLFGVLKSKEINLVERFNPLSKTKSLLGDRGCLLRVLQNLLTNAIHYSPHGDTIEVGFEPVGMNEISFFVKDNGPGVSPEYRDAIFDKFVQLGKMNDGRIYTTGLGLTFCKLAVEAHKGKIFVESDGEKGSCFRFLLPLD